MRNSFGEPPRKKPTFRLRSPLDKKTVLVLEHAHLIGTRTLASIARAAKKSGSLLVLVGESKTLQPVLAGSPFTSLKTKLPHQKFSLRQRASSPEALHGFRDGMAAKVLSELAAKNLLAVEENKAAAVERLVVDWMDNEPERRRDSLIFCNTQKEVDILNSKCQEARYGEGELSGPKLAHRGSFFVVGDRILITKNSAELELSNGQLGTVVSVNEAKKRLIAEIDGERRVIPLKDHPHVELGYAVLARRAASLTCSSAYCLLGGRTQDRELAVFQSSRATCETRYYIDSEAAGENLWAIAHQARQTRAKELAVDRAAEQEQLQTIKPERGQTIGLSR